MNLIIKTYFVFFLQVPYFVNIMVHLVVFENTHLNYTHLLTDNYFL